MFDFGIKLEYPNARRISEKAADIALLIRPFTFFGAFLAGFSLDFFFSSYIGGLVNLYHCFFIGILMGLFQAGGQAYNQSIEEEVEIDRRNGKEYRPTVNGRMTLREAKIYSFILFWFTLAMSWLLSITSLLMACVMVFFAVFYSSKPIRAKRFFIINNLWQAIARGFLPAIFVALLYPEGMTIAIAFGFFFSAWVFGAQTTKDFGDVDGDKAFGVKTFPAVIGWRLSILMMTLVFAYSFFVMNWLIINLYLPVFFAWLNILIFPTLLILYFLKRGISVRFAENNLAWVFFYITLASFYLFPALLVM